MIYVCKQCGSRKTEQPFRNSSELMFTCALCIEKNKKKEFDNAIIRRDTRSELFPNISRVRSTKNVQQSRIRRRTP